MRAIGAQSNPAGAERGRRWPDTVLDAVAAAGTARASDQRGGAARAGIAWSTIPAGTFQMGCVPGDPRCSTDEQPRHAVTLSRPFELMTTEVTVGMFRGQGFHPDEQPIGADPRTIRSWS